MGDDDGADSAAAIPKRDSCVDNAVGDGRLRAHSHCCHNRSKGCAGRHWQSNRPSSTPKTTCGYVKLLDACENPSAPLGSRGSHHGSMSAAGRDQGIFVM